MSLSAKQTPSHKNLDAIFFSGGFILSEWGRIRLTIEQAPLCMKKTMLINYVHVARCREVQSSAQNDNQRSPLVTNTAKHLNPHLPSQEGVELVRSTKHSIIKANTPAAEVVKP